MNILGFLRRAEPQIGLGKRLEQPNLVHIVWTVVDMGDVYGSDVRSSGEIRATPLELGSSQPCQGIYESGIQMILVFFNDVDSGLKILLRCFVLAGAVLNDGEICERFCRTGRRRTIDANLHFDDSFGGVLCLVEYAAQRQLFVASELLGEQFLGCKAGGCCKIFVVEALVGDGNNLIERTAIVVAAIFLSAHSRSQEQENGGDVFENWP